MAVPRSRGSDKTVAQIIQEAEASAGEQTQVGVLVYKSWIEVRQRTGERVYRWDKVWAELEEATWHSSMILYAECQEGLQESRKASLECLKKVVQELASQETVAASATEIVKQAAEDKLNALAIELRLLRGKIADLEGKTVPWKGIRLSERSCVSAYRDEAERTVIVHLDGRDVFLRAGSKKERDELLKRIVQVSTRRAMAGVLLCPEGKEQSASPATAARLARNQLVDPRAKLGVVLRDVPEFAFPTEFWDEPPLAMFGTMRWKEEKEEERERERERRARMKPIDPKTGLELVVEKMTYNKTLHWHCKDLTTIPPALWQMPNNAQLQQLYLENNKIKVLPPQLFGLTSLVVLNLSNNSIEHIDPDIGTLTNLETLTVAYNKIKWFSEEVGGCVSLKNLSVFNNTLTVVPLALSACTSLEMLNLGRNNWKVYSPEVHEQEEEEEEDEDEEEPPLPEIETFVGLTQEILELVGKGRIGQVTPMIVAYIKHRAETSEAERQRRIARRLSREEKQRNKMMQSDAFQRRKAYMRMNQEQRYAEDQRRREEEEEAAAAAAEAKAKG